MADLNLAELDRLEREKNDSEVAGENAAWEALSQLRPLLDLMDRMGAELEDLSWHMDSEEPCAYEDTKHPCAFADYQQAKGEK